YQFAKGDHRPNTAYFKAGNLEKTNQFLQEIKHIADDKSITLAQLVLRWTLDQPGITCALAGARNEKQVKENAVAGEVKITEDEMQFINEKLAALKLEV
ncbi:MAG: aldo/keto reductase, partial [Leptolyngbya sp. SIO3F4]|nr:aldo/keto reductase [Leptolyngbya sp. SIO3F4]